MKIQLQNKNQREVLRVKVIKAPIINSVILRQVIMAREKAIVL